MAYTTINKSTDYFNTKLYTGNGSTQSITGVGFQPDMVWTKQRDAVRNHVLFDAVRGATNGVKPNESQAEFTWTNSVTSFDTNGFSVGGAGEVNYSGGSMASWNWKAGTTGSGTTGGSGTAKAYSYSVNTTAGFSIVKYAGNGSAGHTIPHHLGAVPKMIIVKDLTDNEAWRVYHAGLGSASKYLELNSTLAETTDNAIWDGATPTSSGFLVGSANPVNNSTHDYIAYCFAQKTGYSKFGTYTGNGNADGTFVYTGFKPAFVIQKSSVSTYDWVILDNKRDSFNVVNESLYANLSNAEQTSNDTDFLSNGFKLRSTAAGNNGNGTTFIYMAFAEAPLVGTNNVPANAR